MRTSPFRAHCRLFTVGKEESRHLESGAGPPGRCILTLTQQVPAPHGSG